MTAQPPHPPEGWQSPQPPQPPKVSKGRPRWLVPVSVGVIAFVIGLAIGAAGDGGSDTANAEPKPAATVTVTATATATVTAAPAAAQSSPATNEGSHPPTADIAIGDCTIDSYTHWPSCQITITNHSSKTSNYMVTLSAESPDGSTKYGDLLATVNGLEPGQSSPQKAQGFDEVPKGAKIKLSDVERYAS